MWRGRHGGPRTLLRTTDANLDCAFVENALVFVAPKMGRAQAPLNEIGPYLISVVGDGLCASVGQED